MTKIRPMFSWRVAPILEDAMHSVLLDIASALPWKLLSSLFALIGNFALSSLSVETWALWAFIHLAVLKRRLSIYGNSPGYEGKRLKYIFQTSNTAIVNTRF